MSFKGFKSGTIPPHVLEARAQIPPEYTRNLPSQEMLNSMTPDRMMTLDFTVLQLKQQAQANGSDDALQKADFICERLGVLEKAHFQFSMRPMLFKESNLEFERLYDELFHDILEHEAAWFEKVYPLDPKYSERCVGILGTLATILRQRGQVDECLEILELDAKVLEFYQQASYQPNTPRDQVACCRGLAYKYHTIKVNAHNQKGHKQEAVSSFKECVKYELEEKYTFEQQNWAFILPKTFGVNEQTQLESMSDDQMWQVLQMMQSQFGGAKADLHQHVVLRKCGQCGTQEDKRGDLKTCSKCQVTAYCSRACQKAHWKKHKRDCCKKKSANKENV